MTTSPLVPSNCNDNRVQIMRFVVPSLTAQIYSSLIYYRAARVAVSFRTRSIATLARVADDH